MTIETLAAFYNTELGAVQAWKDIEVDDTLGESLISQGLAVQVGSGGGGGGGGMNTVSVHLVSTDSTGSYNIAGAEYDEGTGEYVVYALVGLASGRWTNELYAEGEMDQSVTCALIESAVKVYVTGGVLTVSGAAEITYQEEGRYDVSVTGDCTLTLATSE